MIYETRENTLKSSKSKSAYSVGESDDRYCKGDNWTGTERRSKRLSTKTLKSESEEYDSLNSDSELSGEKRGTEGDNQMAECEYFYFSYLSNYKNESFLSVCWLFGRDIALLTKTLYIV